MKAREVKRARLCAKYAEKRKALKEQELESLPSAQPLLHHRTSQRLHACFRHQPYSVPRDGQQGSYPWRSQGILVREYI